MEGPKGGFSLMPDLLREGRDRRNQRLDTRINVRLEGEGSRNEFGEFVASTQTFSVWARRSDDEREQGKLLGVEGTRATSEVTYIMRWNPRVKPSATLTDGGLRFIVDAVEPIGRRRYQRVMASYVE